MRGDATLQHLPPRRGSRTPRRLPGGPVGEIPAVRPGQERWARSRCMSCPALKATHGLSGGVEQRESPVRSSILWRTNSSPNARPHSGSLHPHHDGVLQGAPTRQTRPAQAPPLPSPGRRSAPARASSRMRPHPTGSPSVPESRAGGARNQCVGDPVLRAGVDRDPLLPSTTSTGRVITRYSLGRSCAISPAPRIISTNRAELPSRIGTS